MAVVVDYQNVHLTGASLFLPGRPPEEGLIDPYLARSGLYDVVVLASRDTDLAPALDNAARTTTKIEAAKWYDPTDRRTRGNIHTRKRLWTTSMTRAHFTASLDPRAYP